MNKRTRRLLQTQIVSTAELAALTGVPATTLQKWVERGRADCVKKGHTFLFDRRDFARHIAGHVARRTAGHGPAGPEGPRQGVPPSEVPAGDAPAGDAPAGGGRTGGDPS